MASVTLLSTSEPPPYLDAGLASVPHLLSLRVSSLATRRGNQQAADILSRPPAVPICNNSKLLSLPLEIRLQVYDWVFLANPIQEKPPSEGYPLPALTQPNPVELVGLGKDEEYGGHGRLRQAVRSQLCAERLYCYMPSNLLRANRQIYAEARCVPFHNNEFVYRNWFSSGVVKASIIIGEVLQPWQRNAMRSARVETMPSDLHNESGLRAWRELSKSWANGLRELAIVIQVCKEQTSRIGTTTKLDDLLGEPSGWALHGNWATMRAMERLEIELDTPACPKSDKLAWCAQLQTLLWQHGSKAIVVCVQEVQASKK